jgi:hypothetical protein
VSCRSDGADGGLVIIPGSYDAEVAALKERVDDLLQRWVSGILVPAGGGRGATAKRALMSNITQLCEYYGAYTLIHPLVYGVGLCNASLSLTSSRRS